MERRRNLEEGFEWTEYRAGAATVVFKDDGQFYFYQDEISNLAELVPLMVLLNHPMIRRRALPAPAQRTPEAA